MSWQLQDAKARLSEVVKLAQSEGPQAITVHGKPAAVLVSREEYERLAARKLRFTEFIRRSPLAGVEFELKRDRSPPRKVKL
jgi:prevent-host-death family protein